eukprot:2496064-Alexandrium_andersonii.AAC.1
MGYLRVGGEGGRAGRAIGRAEQWWGGPVGGAAGWPSGRMDGQARRAGRAVRRGCGASGPTGGHWDM